MMAKRVRVFRGDRLRGMRERLDISQDELAARLGFGASQMNRYENGKSDPALDTIKRMAAELQISADWLLGLTNEPNESFQPPGLSALEWKLIVNFRNGDVAGLMRTALDSTTPDEGDDAPRPKTQKPVDQLA